MPVLTFPFGRLQANAHLLHNGQDAILADPPDDPAPVLNALKKAGLCLRAVILTHVHFDHCYGAAAMIRASGLPVLAGKEDWEMRDIFLAQSTMLYGLEPVPPFVADMLVPGPMQWGTLHCQILHTPGHSPGSMCVWCAEEKALLSGDVLFRRAVGRSDFPGGDTEALLRSLREGIYTLPSDTRVYSGHGKPTTVGEEAAKNPFCRA